MTYLTLERALVVGSALIGVGLFLGLRERPSVYVTTAPAAIAAAEPPMTQRSQTTTVLALDDGKSAMLVRQALDSHRNELIDHCWLPSAKDQPAPAREQFEFRLLFNPTGQLVSYAVNDPADGQRLDVARCLRIRRPQITLPSSGRRVTVQLALDLP